jgi:hypothetical protein
MHTLTTIGYCLLKLNMCIPYNDCLVCKIYCIGKQMLKWWSGSWYKELKIWCHYFKWPQSPITSIGSLMSYTQSTGWQISTVLIWEVPEAHIHLQVEFFMMHKLKTIVTRNVNNYKQNSWTHQLYRTMYKNIKSLQTKGSILKGKSNMLKTSAEEKWYDFWANRRYVQENLWWDVNGRRVHLQHHNKMQKTAVRQM